jgi:hypothetical protein
VTLPVPWIASLAAQRGLRYEPDADERWLRAWEPFATVRVPIRYEHALHATGTSGSISIARAVVSVPSLPDHHPATGAALVPAEMGCWIVIAQDERLRARAAATSDVGGIFGEPLDLVPMPRRTTGDPAFDHVFASFAPDETELQAALGPSVRKLLLSWRIPVHAELRPGGFVLAPVGVRADPAGLSWLVDAVSVFGAKAQKRAT